MTECVSSAVCPSTSPSVNFSLPRSLLLKLPVQVQNTTLCLFLSLSTLHQSLFSFLTFFSARRRGAHRQSGAQHPSSCPTNDGPSLVEGCTLSFTSCFDLFSDRLRVMADMMHDCVFTPTKGDGSGPLRAGPH